jgi:hypothetical protein
MSKWNHAICDACWDRQYPDRPAVRIRDGYRDTDLCCVCSEETDSGIYFRADPAALDCEGLHRGDAP